MRLFGPGNKEMTVDEETVEILEIIEECPDYSDLDDEYTPIYTGEY